MDDNEALTAIAQLQAWAQEKFGEREFKHYRVTHRWHQSRTASGRPRNDGGYYRMGNKPEVPLEEYKAGYEQGREEELKAFMGKRRGMSFNTYEQKQVRDGWQDHLARMVVEAQN